MDRAAIRAVSATLFNNDKFIEVVRALGTWDRHTFTTQEIATTLGITHDLVKKVLNRLEDAALIKRQQRIGGIRGALPFEVQQGPVWDALIALALVVDEGS